MVALSALVALVLHSQQTESTYRLDFIWKLQANDPPKAPSKPNVIDYDNMSVTLQWEPPTDNGGRPVLGYVAEMKDKFIADWIELMKLLFLISIPIAMGTVLMGWDLHHREASAFESAIFNSLNQNFFALAICVFIIGYFYRCNKEYLLPCSRSDPELDNCIRRSFNHLRPYLARGLPDLDVPPVEPLFIDRLVMANDAGPVRATYLAQKYFFNTK